MSHRARTWLRLGVLSMGLGSVAQAPKVERRPSLEATITAVSFASDGYYVVVTHHGSSTGPARLLFDGKSYEFTRKAPEVSVVHVPDPSLTSLCRLHGRVVTFQLSGVDVDGRERSARIEASPTFSMEIGSVGNAGGLAIVSDDDKSKISIVAGSVRGTYGCTSQIGATVRIRNDTSVAPRHLEVVLHDVDGTKIGSAPATVGPKSYATASVDASSAMSGQIGSVTVHLADASNELGSKLMIDRVQFIRVKQSGTTRAIRLVE